MTWLRTHRVPIIAGVVGLIIGAAIGAGGKKGTTATVTNSSTIIRITTVAVRGRAPKPRVIVRTRVVTHTATAQASTTAAAVPSGGGRSFSGSGQSSVGTINVSQDSTLSWTCSGDCSIFTVANNPNDANQIALASYGPHSGKTQVVAGTYTQVQVITGGTWSFSLSPG